MNLDCLETIVKLCNSKHTPKLEAWCSHREMILLPPIPVAYTPVSVYPGMTKFFCFFAFELNRMCAKLLPCSCTNCQLFKIHSMSACTKIPVAGQFGNARIFYEVPDPKAANNQQKAAEPKRRTVPKRSSKKKKKKPLWKPTKRCTGLICNFGIVILGL